ncbi:type III secretion HpaP family protein [Parendozoicomonas sp. Alg238-R29]|uniref:type III secretion HpaP family protein n=1 Tax=Parendozoicomonas sp. Alg238-R29 TaxID=2993446 RepID=UPI00248E984C|nr:type III secretion HpaP family protein [Parendozoicomonas sp. Alg238-R29]
MSSVQGPASTPQQSGPSENGRAGQNDRTQEKEAERNSGEFDDALKKKKGDKGGRGDVRGNDNKKDGLEDLFKNLHSQKKDKKDEGDAMAHGDAAKTMEARMGKTAEVQGVDNKQMVDKIDKIVDKIMVSNASDVKAVKVDFKNDMLPGTEMMIRKDATGKMSIEFTTTSAESFNFLNKGEQALMDTLNKKMGGDIEVNIKMQGGGADQDTGDGRSREQYFADDNDDEADS